MSPTNIWKIILAFVLSLSIAGAAQAQDKQLYWDRLDVEMTVLTNADIRVVETQEIVFTNGTFTQGSRNIPRDRLDAITDVEVWEGNRQFAPDSRAPYGFATSLEGGDFSIRWYFPETSGRHTYTLKYTVKGGLRFYEGGDQLWWKAVFPDRKYPVNSSQVTVILPEGITPSQLKIESYGAAATFKALDGGQIVFTAQNIQPGQALEVRVQFPHSIVKGTAPAWQVRLDQGQTGSATSQGSPYVVGLVLAGLGILGYLIYRAGKGGWLTTGWSGGSWSSGGDSGGWSGGGDGGGDSGGWSGGGDGGGDASGGGGGDFG